jgi:hypothetical protein
VLTHVDAVRSWNSFDPGIFTNLDLASFSRKMIATEQKLPSVWDDYRRWGSAILARSINGNPCIFVIWQRRTENVIVNGSLIIYHHYHHFHHHYHHLFISGIDVYNVNLTH